MSHSLRSVVAAAIVLGCASTAAQKGTSTTPPSLSREESMSHESSDRNKQLVRSVYETCINERRLELLSRLVGERFAGPGGRGPAGFAKNVEDLITAFPDIRFTIEDVIGEGSRVAVRWAWVGTHRSPFRGIPATNKTVTNTGIAIYEIEEDRIVGNWLETDRLGVLQAISAVPQSFAAGQ